MIRHVCAVTRAHIGKRLRVSHIQAFYKSLTNFVLPKIDQHVNWMVTAPSEKFKNF